MDGPTVSVVMPAYNAAKFIESSIQSVLSQSFRDLELIVIDDCSTDDTTAVVQRIADLDPRVHLIGLSRNRGAPAGPRNVGIGSSRGKWIAFLDADDLWHPDKLHHQLQVLSSSGARFCSTQMFDFVDEQAVKFTPVSGFAVERISFLKQLIKFRTPTSSVVVDADLIRRHPFNEDLSYKAREDLDCWLNCHEEIRSSVKIRHPLLGYRIVPGQISGKKWQMVRRHYHVLRRYRMRDGRSLGLGAVFFTLTHFSYAFYYRFWKKTL